MEIKIRLKEFLSHLKIGQNKFAEKCGFSAGYINNIKGSIGSEILAKISAVYPELNTVWLLTGEGKMLRAAVTDKPQRGEQEHTEVEALLREQVALLNDQISFLRSQIKTKDETIKTMTSAVDAFSKKGLPADTEDYAAQVAEG